MGFYRSWHPNGALELDGNYDGDLKIGTWIRWDSTGRRVEEVTFVEGEKHGNEVEWNIDGTVRKWLHYRHGKLHGRYIWFKPGYCINTLYNNPYLFDVIAADQFYVDGDMIAPLGTVSSDSGDIVGCEFQKPYYNLELDVWIVQPSREREYEIGKRVDGKREGTWTIWTEDGSMIRQEFYEQGVCR
jgi:antitoxin component YwqK of YwqJK toxin-antitoxin module